MFNSKKVIKVGTGFEELDTPQPSSKFIPDWYKKLPRFEGSNKPLIDPIKAMSNKSIKTCVPFLDSFMSGYMVSTWSDIQVRRDDEGQAYFTWLAPPDIVKLRPDEMSFKHLLPVPSGHYAQQFVWYNPFTFKLPSGYSALITHPLNRFELPFTTLSGVVDADKGLAPGHLPFYLKEGFEGLIPKNTPMFQILPIKRESWEIDRDDPTLSKLGSKLNWNSSSVTHGFYKQNMWERKNYN